MSAELARRLVNSGAPPAQVEAALFDSVNRGVALTQAVNELYPELVELLERALDRTDFPAVHTVRPLPDLVRSLPPGMCERLLSLPVHRDSVSDRVDVASVDVLDSHVASEFAFHLGAPVRVLRAPFLELVAALGRLHLSGIFLPGLSKIVAVGGAPAAPEASEPDAPRLGQGREPLTADHPFGEKSLAPNPTWTEEMPEFSLIEPPPQDGDDDALEPVLSLSRPKPFVPAEPEAVGPPWALEFEVAVQGLDDSETPEQVVTSLCEGLRPVRALVFAVRSASFDVRGGSAAFGSSAELRAISVPAGYGSLLDAAARAGFYLGPATHLSALPMLEGTWPVQAGSDCYARAVNVSERPSLILLMAGFNESNEATRRADVLARAAGAALERIVRSRKRG